MYPSLWYLSALLLAFQPVLGSVVVEPSPPSAEPAQVSGAITTCRSASSPPLCPSFSSPLPPSLGSHPFLPQLQLANSRSSFFLPSQTSARRPPTSTGLIPARPLLTLRVERLFASVCFSSSSSPVLAQRPTLPSLTKLTYLYCVFAATNSTSYTSFSAAATTPSRTPWAGSTATPLTARKRLLRLARPSFLGGVAGRRRPTLERSRRGSGRGRRRRRRRSSSSYRTGFPHVDQLLIYSVFFYYLVDRFLSPFFSSDTPFNLPSFHPLFLSVLLHFCLLLGPLCASRVCSIFCFVHLVSAAFFI
jgi:hypothetical protein